MKTIKHSYAKEHEYLYNKYLHNELLSKEHGMNI